MLHPEKSTFVMTKIEGSKEQMHYKSMQWLDMWLTYELKRGNDGCLIFDIDDTVLTENKKGDEVLIKPVANLYKKYRDLGVPVFFVTARPDFPENRKATKEILEKLGLGGYKKLYLMGKDFGKSVETYKFSKRNEILGLRMCNRILARVGDMGWDSLPPSSTFKGDTSILKKIKDEECYIIFHPKLCEVSVKLPA